MTDPLVRLMLVPGVREALADAEASIDAVQLSARRRHAEVRADALAASAAASAALDEADPVATAALLMELEGMQVRESLLQALARMELIVGVDRSPGERGRPHAEFTGHDRLTALAELVAKSSAPAYLVASIAHGEVLDLAPFTSGNGVIARATWRAIMIEMGLEPTGIVMHEVGLRDLGGSAYAAALAAYRSGTAEGIAAWIGHCSRATVLGVDALAQLLKR
jgi:Fic family protein